MAQQQGGYTGNTGIATSVDSKGQPVTMAGGATTPSGSLLSPTIGHDPSDPNKAIWQIDPSLANSPYLQQQLGTLQGRQNDIANQTAFQAGTTQAQAANVNQQGFNAQAQNLAQLQQQSVGQGPAAQAVQMQAQNAMNQGINAQMAMAGSQRGGNAGEALRQASVGQANVTGQAANQAAMNTLASEQQGITNAGQVAGAMQGESLGAAGLAQNNSQFNAGAANTASLNNASMANQFQTNKDQLINQLMTQGMSLQQAQYQANIAMGEFGVQSASGQYAANQGHAIAQEGIDVSSVNAGANIGTAAGGILQGAGSIIGSDKRIKTNVKPGQQDVSDFLDHLKAKSWDYKDPDRFGHGRKLGVMAQDLEKSTIGKRMVFHDHDGTKMVDYGKGMAAIVASLAHLNEKIHALESKRGSKK